MKIIKVVFLCSLWFVVISCNQQPNNVTSSEKYKASVYQIGNSEFGYNIYKDSSMIIHQSIIPSAQGNTGFYSKEDAKKVADLVIYKLNNNIIPPSITFEELDSLGVTLK